ncbi:MAG: BspA family leucine-rich repeat surface protein [Bacteroidetes bacterium]|jgi:surface protein|nr:BspA family leucine-rich repeat surface protein [Bacteroidota bacterium]MBK7589075.1 BspA family leucine-rich repeat surface protein [Bacteroidota bacterium]MBK8329473.1 BspA family leucine-rich repeat surface protein [Bacteroidota bacterium]MBK9299284.1 BspA family leucine-rich repeat surface protein [Bacteroidota bacterium]MBK9481275.1 BspA family leucine-rich repeat surface protein [Bacteroidota bacterium]
MKKYLFSFLFLSFNFLAHAQDFITHWDLSLPGSGATQLTFGVGTSGTCSYTWETIPAGSSGTDTFSGNTISITGLPAGAMIRLKIDTTNFRRIIIYNGFDKSRLKDIEQWGGVRWSSMQNAFWGCGNLNCTATDIPDLSLVTDMSYMFCGCVSLNSPANIGNWDVGNVMNMSSIFREAISFNQPIGNWNTSLVTNMSFLFSDADAFNQPIGNWNTSNVTNMTWMFCSANSFNQPIGNWNTSNVTDMTRMFLEAWSFNQPIGNWNTANVYDMNEMFAEAHSFNQPIGSWNTGNVLNMHAMFSGAVIFNQPIGSWNTANVLYMNAMFYGAGIFNQPIGNWNTSNVINMAYMFFNAWAFNQPIGSWNTSNVTFMNCMFSFAYAFNQPIGNWLLNPNVNLTYMLSECGMDCINYSTTLSGWANNMSVPINRVLGADNLKYLLYAQTTRNYLVNVKGWIIIEDTIYNNCCTTQFDTIYHTTCNPYFFNGELRTITGFYYDSLVSNSGCDSLITLFLTLNYSTFTFSDSACNSYFFNGQTITNSGTYYDTLMNANGCDSLITLNLTINQTDTSLLQTGALLTANATGATYQWLTCNPFQEIIGETNQNFIAAANGDYAVIVTQNGCTDTSACYTVNNVGINNFDLSNNIKIFPNPVSQNLQIESATAFQNANIKILNITGLVIAEYLDISTKTFSIDMSSYSSGSYLIQITSPSYKYIKRIYKGQ